MPLVQVEITIAAPPEDSWKAVVDVESYSACMDSVQSVVVLEGSGEDRRTTAWSVRLKGSVLEWVEAEQLDHASRRFDFHQVSGDLAHFVGHWAVRPSDGGGSLVSLTVEFEIGIPLLAEMLNPVAAAALRDNARQMLQALERRLTAAVDG
ncbi:type II toxin-antitoxin system RatA family toxin [Streptomyces neyagawaensis]|uniref:type II toxin-antitoxin system RatA family toxin n=1 Tax=Streptomyces neyagawaensis TaxID=42238 RepID=UPI0006E38BB5|nr:SRPBCC family protein [Streptomyces neyagawaensis]MCL6739373.1 SRPBCC family protein [Streptomyces neyagawaensis]MDE1688939.1 SRPBCC family protein [Streptomyces neyagawaensis]